MPNRFRDKVMRTAYDSTVQHHEIKHAVLFHKDGTPNTGNGIGGPFWRGFRGEQANMWDAASKQTIAYAYWCAGRDVAAAQR